MTKTAVNWLMSLQVNLNNGVFIRMLKILFITDFMYERKEQTENPNSLKTKVVTY